jgi:hypothetical protein
MRLDHRDFPGKRSPLKSIEVKGDSLLWTYQSGFFAQNASVPISSLVSIHYEKNELIWTYRIFASDGSGRVDDVAETLSAEGQTQSEKDYLSRLYWDLLKTFNPQDYSSRRNAESNSSQETSGSDPGRRQNHNAAQDSTNNANRHARQDASDSRSYSSSRQQGQSASQSSTYARTSTTTDLKNALRLLGGSLSIEKKRKFKSTLRLIHHPDHGGDQEFFIELESVFTDLDW